jgi:hypothetical protein
MLHFLAQNEPPETNFWSIERTTDLLYLQKLGLWILLAMVVAGLIFVLLARIPSNFRRPVVVGITFLSGLVYVLQWILPKSKAPDGSTVALIGGWNFSEAIPVVSGVSQILSGMLLAMGVYSIFRLHFGRVFKGHKDAFFSIVLLISLFVMVVFGFMDNAAQEKQKDDMNLIARVKSFRTRAVGGNTPEFRELAMQSAKLVQWKRLDLFQRDLEEKIRKGEKDPSVFNDEMRAERAKAEQAVRDEQARIAAEYQQNQTSDETLATAREGAQIMRERSVGAQLFNLVFFDMYQPLETGMFSLIAFFILSAAFRAFRIRSIEATILMATALVVLLSFIPLALALTSGIDPNSFAGNFRLDSIGNWLLGTLNTSAIRGIDLGLGLGVLAMALRILLGLERGVAVD